MQEAEVEDVRHYRSIGQLFQRRLKPTARVIDFKQPLVGILYDVTYVRTSGVTHIIDSLYYSRTVYQ